MTVSIGAVRSAGGAATYFASDNYYTAEQSESMSSWAGEGAKAAGLTGPVEAKTFEAVLGGTLPDGTQVGQHGRRDHGRDFTFSMPKSASLLAFVSGDKRILQAHMAAVRQTMAWAEKNLAEARLKVDGRAVPVRTGNLLYALFPHDTSRATDPQGHIHAVIANMTRLPAEFRQPDKVDPATGEMIRDHGWRAWHNAAVYQQSAVLTSMANAIFRTRLEALGYTIVHTGKHGAFEIAGVNRKAIDGFSKRSADIKAKAEELGIVSPEGRRAVTQRTRDPKRDPGDRTMLVDRWREEAKGYGYTGDMVVAQALERSRDGRSLVERGAAAFARTLTDVSHRLSAYLVSPQDPLAETGLTRMALSPVTARTQAATASAIRILGEREAAFRTSDIVKTALDLGEKGVTPERVEQRMAELNERGLLVPERSTRLDGATDFVTTSEAIAQERRILAAMDAGAGAGRSLMPADVAAVRLQELAGEHELNAQQLAAAIHIVSSPDRIVLVQGRAGAGKSTMLQPVAKAEALDAAARLLGERGAAATLLTADIKGSARGLAFQNKMVADLRADTGLEATTVHGFIAANARFLENKASPEAFAVRKRALAGSYLILDEGSMISTDQMDRLTAIANLMEVGRLAIIGDRKQLNPIDAGKSFSLMQAKAARDAIPVAQVNINMRQRTETMRAVADLADAGNVRAAIEVLGERVVESEDRVGAAAAAWLALDPEAREKTTLLPAGREGRARANALIQDGLKAEGTLGGEGRGFVVRERVNLTHEDLRYARNWTAASVVEIGSAQNRLGLAPGDYRIRDVRSDGTVVVAGARGKTFRVDPRKINPTDRNDRIALSSEKSIRVHDNEHIRWTHSDKTRGMLNATTATVEAVSVAGITVRLSGGEERILANGDPMLTRMDLAYAINTHMAQGITNETVFSVMGSRETNLSNARSFLVNHTRQQLDVRLFTDDKDRLVRQLEGNHGDKTSALETIGELAVESTLRSATRTGKGPGNHGDGGGEPRASPKRRFDDSPQPSTARESGPGGTSEPQKDRGRGQPEPDRSKGLEL